uniref:Uncharacterized protein n=1 Tax=Wuchereria bancrofti TaxID=6293 RepID=A0AAF5Q099_WUCBA
MTYVVEALSRHLVQEKVQYRWAELSNPNKKAPVTQVATVTGGGASAIIRQDISAESKLSRWGPTEICKARVRGNSLKDKICEEAVIIDRAATGGRADDPKAPPQPSSCQTLKSVISI